MAENFMERKYQKSLRILSNKDKQEIVQSNLNILDSILQSSFEEPFLVTAQRMNIKDEVEPSNNKKRFMNRVPIKKNVHRRTTISWLNIKDQQQMTSQWKARCFYQRKQLKLLKNPKAGKLNSKSNFVPLAGQNIQQKGTQLLLEIFRDILGTKDQTRRVVEFKEKEKGHQLKAFEEKVKRLIVDGLISPDKPGSYTFQYDGSIIPVNISDFIVQKRIISVQAEVENKTINNIIGFLEKKRTFVKEEQQNKPFTRMRYHSLGENQVQTSKFLKNFDSLGSVWQVTKSKENLPQDQASTKQKRLFSPSKKLSNRRSKISISNSQILKDEIFDLKTFKRLEKVQEKNQYRSRIQLRKRFKCRSSFRNYFQQQQ